MNITFSEFFNQFFEFSLIFMLYSFYVKLGTTQKLHNDLIWIIVNYKSDW